MNNDGVAGGDGLELPLIRQKSKIFATFPRGEGLAGGRLCRPYRGGRFGGRPMAAN